MDLRTQHKITGRCRRNNLMLQNLPRCKTLEHYQRGAWKAHGVYPIQHHPTGLPALVVRPGSHAKTGSYTCERYLSVPEQQPWEPNLLGRRACNAITNFNRCFDVAAAQESGDVEIHVGRELGYRKRRPSTTATDLQA